MSQLPTAEQVTNLYLYGTTTKPTEMTSESLIRPDNFQIPLVPIDAAVYMAGPGRPGSTVPSSRFPCIPMKSST